MKVPEKGVVYRASPRAYVGNYLIGAGVVALAAIVISRLGLALTLSPSGFDEAAGTLAYFGFGAVALWLFAESFLEGSMRHYVVSNNEIVKVEGVLWKRRHAISIQSVSEVRVTKGLFGRILNYGTVEVTSMSEGHLDIRHVNNPDEIQRLIQHKTSSVRSAGGPRARKEDKEESAEE